MVKAGIDLRSSITRSSTIQEQHRDATAHEKVSRGLWYNIQREIADRPPRGALCAEADGRDRRVRDEGLVFPAYIKVVYIEFALPLGLGGIEHDL
jgi:hypothetical protein